MKIKKTLFLLSLCLCTYAISAQNQFQIGDISVINMGDGRLLFRESESEKTLTGEHRIIDGYRSEYILAEFADGLYNGKYEHFKNNKLIDKGEYREGRKNGLFVDYYSDGQSVKKETPYLEGKLDGIIKEYFTDGSLSLEKGYKAGVEHGPDRKYDSETKQLRLDHNYSNGVMDGRQFRRLSGRVDHTEEKYFDKGKPVGKYIETWADGTLKVEGQYKEGVKDGVWIENRPDGVRSSDIAYRGGKRHGMSRTYFTDGSIDTEINYVDGKKDGLERQHRDGTNFLRAENTWAADKKTGPYKRWDMEGRLTVEGRMVGGNEVWRKEYHPNGKVDRVQERPSGSGPWKTLESYDLKGKKLAE